MVGYFTTYKKAPAVQQQYKMKTFWSYSWGLLGVQDLQIHLELCMDQRLLQVLAQDPF
jgi:hypothetical protein